MKKKNPTKWWLAAALILILGAGSGRAQDPAAYAPEPVKPDDFANLSESSPFTRPLNLADSLILAGLVNINGRPIATLIDEETKEVHLVSDEPNDQGWKIVEISSGGNLEKLSATISVSGAGVTTLRFEDERLKPTKERVGGSGGAKGGDTRPKPTDKDRRKFGEYVRKRMSKMSDEQRKKVGKIMHDKSKVNPNMSDRQKGELFIKILDHVEREGRK